MQHDRYAFAIETARALRAGDLTRVDTEAVAEELEAMGRSDARELESRLIQVLVHMLKLMWADGILLADNQRAWKASIIRQHEEIELLLRESPILKSRLRQELIEQCYSSARRMFIADFGLDEQDETVWRECPFQVAEVLPERLR
jgi:hypothetical protein